MVTIIGLCGSLRSGSFNRRLLDAAVELSPPATTIEPESIGGIPLYDADVEEQGMPVVVQRLKDRIARADGLLIVTPEYNNFIPDVLKNTIDWLSPSTGRNVLHRSWRPRAQRRRDGRHTLRSPLQRTQRPRGASSSPR
jgi:NAD(P)H-dependent FMN reductase